MALLYGRAGRLTDKKRWFPARAGAAVQRGHRQRLGRVPESGVGQPARLVRAAVDPGLDRIVALHHLLIRFTPDSLTYSVPLFLKRHCDRTPG
jgi:hypothetical protein